MFLFTTNFQWSKFGQWLRKTINSWSTSQIRCPKAVFLTEFISLMFWIPFSHNTCSRSFVMQTNVETPFRMRPKPEKPSKFRTSGGKPWTQCRLFHVSLAVSFWSKLIYYPMNRIKRTNSASAETKLQASPIREKEEEDWYYGHVRAIHAR